MYGILNIHHIYKLDRMFNILAIKVYVAFIMVL